MAGLNLMLPVEVAVSQVSSSTEDDIQDSKNPWYAPYFRALEDLLAAASAA